MTNPERANWIRKIYPEPTEHHLMTSVKINLFYLKLLFLEGGGRYFGSKDEDKKKKDLLSLIIDVITFMVP